MSKEIEYLDQISHELQQRHMDMIADDECDNEAISIIIDDYKEKFSYIKKALKRNEPIKFDIARCPKCGKLIEEIDNINYCGGCGQRLIWNE